MEKNLGELRPFSRNDLCFDDMTGDDFEELKESIKENGVIEPIVVNQENVIVCGHQRYRACVELGLENVPIVVREVENDEEHETLLIEENLRRRQLTTSQMAKAIKRLYEIKEVERTAGRPEAENNRLTVKQLSKEIGKSKATVAKLRTLADLIPELSKLMDEGQLALKMAYQFAQLPEEGQKEVYELLKEQVTIKEEEAKELKDRYLQQENEASSLRTELEELRSQGTVVEVSDAGGVTDFKKYVKKMEIEVKGKKPKRPKKKDGYNEILLESMSKRLVLSVLSFQSVLRDVSEIEIPEKDKGYLCDLIENKVIPGLRLFVKEVLQ